MRLLTNGSITFAEFKEPEAERDVLQDKLNAFHNEVREWMTWDPIYYFLDDRASEEAYGASINLLHEYLMER